MMKTLGVTELLSQLKLAQSPTPSVSAVPQLEIVSTPAPGKRGPIGTAPRTNYSRVHTGVPPTPDAGAAEQKALPPKYGSIMSEQRTAVAARPTLQDMVKAAMAGAITKTKIAAEARRQAENFEPREEKVASPQSQEDLSGVTTDKAIKCASALEYLASNLDKIALDEGASIQEHHVEPGKGPGALHVMQVNPGAPLPQHMGEARHGKIPVNPGTEHAHLHDPATAMETNMNHVPGSGKTASVFEKNLARLGLSKVAAGSSVANYLAGGLPGAYLGDLAREGGNPDELGAAAYPQFTGLAGMGVGGLAGAGLGGIAGGVGGFLHKRQELLNAIEAQKGKKKQGSADLFSRNLSRLGLEKQADDGEGGDIASGAAAGAKAPPGVSATGEMVPHKPANASMVDSVEKAINLTRGQAKAQAKKEMDQVMQEKSLSAQTDRVLQLAFNHTGEAGPKVASSKKVAGVAPTVIGAGERGLMQHLMGSGATRVHQAAEGAKALEDLAAKGVRGSDSPHAKKILEWAGNQRAASNAEHMKDLATRAGAGALGVGALGAAGIAGHALGSHAPSADPSGVHMASVKTAAARAIIEKLAEEQKLGA